MITCTYNYINQKYSDTVILRMLVSADEPISVDDVETMDCYEEIHTDVSRCSQVYTFKVELNQLDDTLVDVIFEIKKPIPKIVPAPELKELERLLKDYGSRQR